MKKYKKGHTFIEMIIAMFISVLIMVAVSAVFSRFLLSYRSAKGIQRDLEGAQYSMDLLAKNLRTSSVVSSGTNEIKFYNYSGPSCIDYKVIQNKLQMASATDNSNDQTDKKVWCRDLPLSNFSDINGPTVNNLNFSVTLTSLGSTNTIGRVTISMEICSNASCSGSQNDKARIQTTVSLRDYSVIY
jgi:Tfp pilus assembly protein PilV